MHPVLFYESFFFCSRNDLERLQPMSRSLRNLIVNRSRTLPLRAIDRVFMDVTNVSNPEAEIQVFVKEDGDAYEPEPDYEASLHDGDFAETFRRLQNTCIDFFDVWINDSPFMRYWIAQEAAAFTVVTIYFNIDIGFSPDYDVFDSIVNHVRPKTTYVGAEGPSRLEDGMNSEHMKLLARKSLLDSLRTCCLRVFVEGFPPPSFFFNDPGYAKYELWCDHPNAAKRIDGFIESFYRDGCTNRKLESVFVGWHDDEDHQSPAPKHLSKPIKCEIPLPKMDMPAWLTRGVHQVTQCEVHSFVNTKHWMRMDVYKWSDYHGSDRRRVTHILRCRVSDL
ncbi:hypothetical protein AAVH_14555 [Aphelenchoides avenae]|nr:hypothetical protein AAVH_14555 [Aphelenchus avenae]